MFEDIIKSKNVFDLSWLGDRKLPELKASDIIPYVRMTIRFSQALTDDVDGVCYVYEGYGVEAEQLYRIPTFEKNSVTIEVPADTTLWIAAIGLQMAMWVGGKFIAKKEHINDIWLQANYEQNYRGY